ncbi:MAG: polyribonucleotide nucleotidyltransferase [Deltaproteobacteria bacterium]|nr:polyribonucleotide nucleotidyltransferase [Deltaproteobacteria bacterium]MBW2309856.1 polyribonucleotide nucleotidyltransferase [Deltaproteobacteria bacterium]
MIKNVTRDFNGRTINVETGRVAGESSGAVVVTMGETVVLVTVVSTDQTREGVDFLPLTVDFQEMSYAAGKIPGNFWRRDMGRPSEKEILTSRLIDRPLRPLFPDGYNFETQIIASVLSFDRENDPDPLGILGASAAITLSDIPFMGPVGSTRVGRIDGKFIAFPTLQEQEKSDIDLIVVGTKTAVVMVEAGSKFVSEDDMLDAIFFGHESLQPIIDMQLELREAEGKEKRNFVSPERDGQLMAKVTELGETLMREALLQPNKVSRQKKKAEVSNSIFDSLQEEYGERKAEITDAIHDLERRLVRHMVLKEGRRVDGRSFTEVRPIECLVGVLPRVHGSALFTRGETQALVSTTLGTESDEQRIESIYGDSFRRFTFHYNFPPFSVGEARRLGAPGRREIGHGALARRALLPVLIEKEDFPYAIRVVSEILESNGSSSMASVCGGSLSVMDAGVPVTTPVAGVAMGLISEDDEVAILTDIMGDEDHFGDMDFKVAGTRNGITALQMDIKIDGLTKEIMGKALSQAKEARMHVLDEMDKALSESRLEVSEYAPRITVMDVKPEKIKDIIGPGGRMIKHITVTTGTQISVDNDGKVSIASTESEGAQRAIEMIKELVKEAEVGKLYVGKVVKIVDFGAFVEILPGTEGLIHISQLADERVRRVTDILKEGDEVLVKVLDIDSNGKIRLSRKAALGHSVDET